MDIYFEQLAPSSRFDNLDNGTVFELDGSKFLKIRHNINSQHRYTALNLYTLTLVADGAFNSDTEVVPLGKLVIED
jgi:hypothetical protein